MITKKSSMALHAGRRRPLLSLAVSASCVALSALSPSASAAAPLPAGTLPAGGTVVSGAVINPVMGNVLTINQTAQKAILNWQTFNIAAGSEVRFNQPNAGASALNRIADINPSIIQGKLAANGQVYLINQNGILFDRGSQVNVHTLVASSLGITDKLFTDGLTLSPGVPKFEGGGLGGITALGEIRTQSGGAVMLFGPTVENAGIISAPDGQVILAAGQKVYLSALDDGTTAAFAKNISVNNTQMRGMLVEIKAGTDPVNLTSLVSNTGEIHADHGNVTLAGLAVNQMNLVSAKSSVMQNGSVWLLAKETDKEAGQRTGQVLTGANSVTQTPLDTQDATTLAEDQSYDPFRSLIGIEGKSIVHQGRISSPGGKIAMAAYDPQSPAGTASGRIYLDSGSEVSAAGSWADLAMSGNFLDIQVTSNELKDSPLQRGGLLQGMKVTVDARKGTPLFDISGYKGAVKRGVAEKAANGGDIILDAQGDVIQRAGAVLDVSGGGYRYAGGYNATTKLTAGGKVYDIGAAPADAVYQGALDTFDKVYAKWGVTEHYQGPVKTYATYESGYVEGKAAGSLTVRTGGAVLAGPLKAGITAGWYQTGSANFQALAGSGSLTVGDNTQFDITKQNNFGIGDVLFFSGADPLSALLFDAAGALPAQYAGNAVLSDTLFNRLAHDAGGNVVRNGFGAIALYANGGIHVPAGAMLTMPAGGALTLVADHIGIDGGITAPAGSISLMGVNTLATVSGRLPQVTLGAGSRLAADGLWINDSMPGNIFVLSPQLLQGGRIGIVTQRLDWDPAARITVNGGGSLNAKSVLTRGNGGAISLEAAAGDFFQRGIAPGQVSAYALGKGGALQLTAAGLNGQGGIAIGGAVPGDAGTWWVGEDVFRRGGFTQYGLTAKAGAIRIAAGARIAPLAEGWQLDSGRAAVSATGADLTDFTQARLLPVEQRAPAGLKLSATDVITGGIVMPVDSAIVVDPQSSVVMSAKAGLEMNGRIEAPAGTISLAVDGANEGQLGNHLLHLGPDAVLLSRGYVMPQSNKLNLAQGRVLAGGTVSLTATRNFLAADPGSLIDVSGTAADLDIVSQDGSIQRRHVAGEAGAVNITASQAVRLAGTMLGRAESGSPGGGFTLSLTNPWSAAPLSDAQAIADYTMARRIVAGQAVSAGLPVSSDAPEAQVSLAALRDSGFDRIRLRAANAILFDGDLDLRLGRALKLDAPVIAATGTSLIALNAPQVAIGYSGDANNPMQAPAPVSTASGSARLDVLAGGIMDLYGHAVLNGFNQINLASGGDIRMTGQLIKAGTDPNVSADTLSGSLTTTANLSLTASQLYPATYSDYAIAVKNIAVTGGVATASPVTGGSVNIVSNGKASADALSAAGKLSFEAETINQGGVVAAPLGQLGFNATHLNLLPGSRTSVAGGTQTVPFGATVNGQNWLYAGMPVTRLPQKAVTLSGVDVNVQTGAVVDVSGGGDIQGVEFIPGPGGSKDTLLRANTYAILPVLKDGFAPGDTHLANQGMNDNAVYDSVYLSDMPGLAAGVYPLLPAYYALLPGAYRVTLPAGTKYADLVPGQVTRLPDGSAVVAGYRAAAGAGLRESRWSGFVVSPGDVVRTESEYAISHPDFLAKQALAQNLSAPPLPQDAGRLSVSAAQSLLLQGGIMAHARGGRLAEVDIASNRLAVVSGSGGAAVPSGFLQLDAAALSAMDASVLLGGTRGDSAQGAQIAVTADQIFVNNDSSVPLSGPEFMLAARNSITVGAGSVIRGRGAASGAINQINIAGNGALLRVSSGGEAVLTRSGSDGTQGTLTVESGATLDAAGSMLLDASGTVRFVGNLALDHGSALGLSSSRVSLGEVNGITDGLVLDNAQLAGLNGLDSLSLRSYGTIDFYGDVRLGDRTLQHLALESAGLSGYLAHGANAAVIAADTVSLANTANRSVWSGAPDGTGTLAVDARRLLTGGGNQQIRGYGLVALGASEDIAGYDKGTLSVAGDLKLAAGRITASARSDQQWSANTVDISRHANGTGLAPPDSFGGRLAITGTAGLNDAGNIELPAGSLSLTAASGDLTVADGARIAVAGVQKSFGAGVEYAPAGSVELVAGVGNVRVLSGSEMDVSGAGGGDAGGLSLRAGGAGTLAGTVKATAQAGNRQGSVTMDVGTLADFSALNNTLNQAGFGEARQLRVRAGDVTVAAADTVAAHAFKLAVDSGNILVSGRIDTSGLSGGKVELDAGNNLTLAAGSMIDARGASAAGGTNDAYAHGGNVRLSAVNGALAFDAQSVIDVSAGAKGNGGKVTFTAPRTTAQDGVLVNLAGTVRANSGTGANAGQVVVVGNRVYGGMSNINASVVGATSTNPVWNDYQLFMTNAPVIAGTLGLQGISPGNVHVRAGIELQSAGGLMLNNGWDLTQAGWMQGNEPGVLTLRAAGTVELKNYLGFPNDNLALTPSWALRLAGGADLAAADAMAVLPLSGLVSVGDVRLSNVSSAATGKIRTGTGNIDIAAGRDVVIVNPPTASITVPAAVIYTAGLPGAGGVATSKFPIGGGDIVISAQRDVIGAAAQQPWINEWLRRTTGTQSAVKDKPAEWWGDRAAFKYNVGALGGGNVNVTAGRDVSRLSVMLPTSGRKYTAADGVTPLLDVQGGGDLALAAGRDVIGGDYFVARGRGLIRTGGMFGAPAAKTALYLMGESNDPALKFANISVLAGGDVNIQSVANPTILYMPSPAGTSVTNGNTANYFTYAPASGVSLQSLTGNIALGNSLTARASTIKTDWSDVYVPRLAAVAMQGNIDGGLLEGGIFRSGGRIRLFPSAQGELKLIAGGNVLNSYVRVADVLPSLLPDWKAAVRGYPGRAATAIDVLLDSVTASRIVAADAGGYPYRIAALGDIVDSHFTLPQQAWLQAGKDMHNVNLELQNLHESDLTVVSAGRDIIFTDLLSNGDPATNLGLRHIKAGGPGNLLVQAGRNVNLATSEGIIADGSGSNSSLTTSASAHVAVMAGVQGNIPAAQAETLFTRLRDAGKANDAAAGDAAAMAVFASGNTAPGDIILYAGAVAAQITTSGGSGIDLLAPQGNIYAGPLSLSPVVDQNKRAGVMTFRGGAIRSYLAGDFNINQSKVITLLGGDILLYTSGGGIDAGRGAHDSRTTQQPRRIKDPPVNGVDPGTFHFEVPPDVSGSGIRTATSDPDGPGALAAPAPGSVYLFAPSGTINAGEAGISSAGDVVIAALHVLNASNISYSGSASGVPVADTSGLSAGMTGASSLASGAADSSSVARTLVAAAQASQMQEGYKPSFLTVEVIGMGDDGVEIRKTYAKDKDRKSGNTMDAGLDKEVNE